MPEPICPFNEGQHKKQVWQDRETGRTGRACRFCHKTWAWQGDQLVPTYPEAK